MVELRRELELNPANADASALLALLLVHAGDVPGALPYARKAAGARPGDALAQYAYGEVLMRSGDLRPAIATLEAAERLDPAALEYHMALASAYSRAGRLEDARRERHMSMDMAGDKRPELNAQSTKSGDTRPAENR
jgi:Flp pilus assembly protein TadD